MTTSTTIARPRPRRSAQPARLRRARAFIRRVPRPLGLILVVAALQSIGWDIAVPAFQGPDESAHFAYVQYLAETGKLPSATSGRSESSAEAQGALTTLDLGALEGQPLARPAWSGTDLSLWHQVERGLPRGSRANGPGPNPIARNPPLYYAVMAIPYRMLIWLPLLKRLFVLRLFSALFFLATVALVWLIAGEVFGPVRWKQALAAGVVALQPELSFMSAVINSDTLLITLTTAVLWASLRLVRRGPTLNGTLLASGLTVAAVLTHGRGLVTVPVLATALVLSAVRHGVRIRGALARTAAATTVIAIGFLAYVLFGRSGASAIYGGQVRTLNSGAGFSLRQFISSIYQFYLPRLPDMRPRIGPAFGYRQFYIENFYGTFGSLEVRFSPAVYDALQLLSAVGLAGLYAAVVTHWRRLRRSWHVVVLMLSLLVTNVLFLHYVSYRALLSNDGHDPLIVGRYLLPMVALFGLAIAFTVGVLPRRLGQLTGALILTAGMLLSLGGLGITIVRFYA